MGMKDLSSLLRYHVVYESFISCSCQVPRGVEMSEQKDSHQPSDFAMFAVALVFVIHCLVVFNVPLRGDPSWMKKAFIALTTFVVGGAIYSAAMESVASVLKKVVEFVWALMLLPMVLFPLWIYDGWKFHLDLVMSFGVEAKHAPVVVVIGSAAGMFLVSGVIWLVLYPISMVAGSDPRKLKE